ncbi:MAG TPA: histidine phosphatase family protein [Stellaceae bacterium]|jgi:phosphohistidine phosphatase
MHMLHLLRHAKSSWKDGVEDHQRPLNRRGREAAQRLGRHLPTIAGGIDLVLCSSAARTRETLELALAGFAIRPRCLIEGGLYLADCDKLLDRLKQLEESTGNVLLIGHNPGLHELALALAEPDTPAARTLASAKFPTAARASLCILTRWLALTGSRHPLADYVTVGSLSDGDC